jgi:hypothetical protein
MAGEHTLYTIGRDVPVELVDDGNGNYPERGDPIELVGETPELTQASIVQNAGKSVGFVSTEPANYDHDYENVGPGGRAHAKFADNPVDYYPLDDTGWDQTATDPSTTSASVGDFAAVNAGGGLIQYDSASHAMPKGIVFATGARGEMYRDGKVAIVAFR